MIPEYNLWFPHPKIYKHTNFDQFTTNITSEIFGISQKKLIYQKMKKSRVGGLIWRDDSSRNDPVACCQDLAKSTKCAEFILTIARVLLVYKLQMITTYG